MRWRRWALGGLVVVGLAACSDADDPTVDGATSTTGVTTAPATADTAPPGGTAGGLAARFGTIVAELVTATGDVVELCLLHADVPEERGRGLMEITDLEGHDGMLFSFGDRDVESNFVMIDTVTPLTISWWEADGDFVSTTDMAPCTDADPADCARYGADGPYRHALEVFRGTRPEAAEGARLEVRDGSSCQRS